MATNVSMYTYNKQYLTCSVKNLKKVVKKFGYVDFFSYIYIVNKLKH